MSEYKVQTEDTLLFTDPVSNSLPNWSFIRKHVYWKESVKVDGNGWSELRTIVMRYAFSSEAFFLLRGKVVWWLHSNVIFNIGLFFPLMILFILFFYFLPMHAALWTCVFHSRILFSFAFKIRKSGFLWREVYADRISGRRKSVSCTSSSYNSTVCIKQYRSCTIFIKACKKNYSQDL